MSTNNWAPLTAAFCAGAAATTLLLYSANKLHLGSQKSQAEGPSRTVNAVIDEEEFAPMCVGPECAATPPPRLTAKALPVPVSGPAPLSSINSQFYYCLQSTLRFLNQTSSSRLEFDEDRWNTLLSPYPSAPITAFKSYLEGSNVLIEEKQDVTLTYFKNKLKNGMLPLVIIQRNISEERATSRKSAEQWRQTFDQPSSILVVAVDAFYVYFIDVCEPGNISYLETREFTARWHHQGLKSDTPGSSDNSQGKYNQFAIFIAPSSSSKNIESANQKSSVPFNHRLHQFESS